MKNSFIFLDIVLVAFVLLSACENLNTQKTNKDVSGNSENNRIINEQKLRNANDQFYAALNAMFIGNLEPMNDIWSHSEDVTDMGPFGGRLEGWIAVGEEFKKEGAMKLGGKIVCKDLLVRAGTDMGYTICTEEGENMSADGKPVAVRFRATNIFRFENNQWKMVHHHTDLSSSLQQAATAETK
jgi:ketosteroid isomerase-like protein